MKNKPFQMWKIQVFHLFGILGYQKLWAAFLNGLAKMDYCYTVSQS